MLEVEVAKQEARVVKYWPLALLVAIGIAGLLIVAVDPAHLSLDKTAIMATPPANFSNVKQLGLVLFTDYLYPFEIAAVILLAAMVSAIALTFRGRRKGVRAQIPSKQVQVDPKQRLRVVKMASESKKGGKA